MSDIGYLDHSKEAQFGDFVALLKPRVMSLVVFTAMVGLLVAPNPVHPFVGFVAILFIALGGGASGALNMWYDADIDRVMRRTKGRPIPAGRVTEGEALGFGLALAGISCVMLALASNLFSGLFLAFTITSGFLSPKLRAIAIPFNAQKVADLFGKKYETETITVTLLSVFPPTPSASSYYRQFILGQSTLVCRLLPAPAICLSA